MTGFPIITLARLMISEAMARPLKESIAYVRMLKNPPDDVFKRAINLLPSQFPDISQIIPKRIPNFINVFKSLNLRRVER
jgi:hypothetical protein